MNHHRLQLFLWASVIAYAGIHCGSDSSTNPVGTDDAGTGADGGGTTESDGTVVVGPITGVSTTLPPLPELKHVLATLGDDSASITFDPIEGAKDYRVFVLPADGDVAAQPSGDVAIHNATYRCAGDREAPGIPTDNEPQVQSGAVKSTVNGDVSGFARTSSDATLGYVYTDPGPGRIPVYVLGDPSPSADNGCYFQRYTATRVKKYTTSDAERTSLLQARWRDDGIAFWVPAAAAANTHAVYTAMGGYAPNLAPLYFSDGPEKTARASSSPTSAFQVLSNADPGTEPLLRLFYGNGCGTSHDELAVGNIRYDRIRHQGNGPWWGLLWSGITGPTTLVVEALDKGCPFQGHLSPRSIAANAGGLKHQAFLTLDELRAASPTGEVFINGQHEPANRPKAIARSFISASPHARPAMDWFAHFSSGSQLAPFTESGAGFQNWHLESADYHVGFYGVETGIYGFGLMMGELWSTFADWGSDVSGKFRMTPKTHATLADASYVHVTMEVDIVSTHRRYPQLFISDREWPVQENMNQGKTLVVQTFGSWPTELQIQECDHLTWDVNPQCPKYQLYHADSSKDLLPPNAIVSERWSLDNRSRFDVYASTHRVYLFADGQPYGCANLATTGNMPAGPVTVTFGDVLYHSGADVTNTADTYFTYHRDHLNLETQRHWDNLGFKSGVAAPVWDENRLPCTSALAQ